MISIYTDGSCIKNNNGGWAFCIVNDDEDIIVSGTEKNTTNNRMELIAVIESLDYINHINYDNSFTYNVYSDSLLTINCATNKWKRKSNLDLWKEFDIVSNNKKINFIWVKAHNGNKYNELVDVYARNEAQSLT